jgi:hypothetical protein
MNKILLPLVLIGLASCRQNPESQVKDVVLSPAEIGKAHQVIWLDGTAVKSGACPANSATPTNRRCQGLTAGPTAALEDFSDALTVAILKSRPDGNTRVIILDPAKLAQIEEKIKRLSDKIAAGGLTPAEETSLESQVASLKLERDKLKVELTEAETKDKQKIINALNAGQDITLDEGERLFGYAMTAFKSAWTKNWSDVTVAGSGAASCDGSPENCTKRDNKTGLIWSRMAKDKLNWDNAVKYCNELTHNGTSGWKLPTKDELVKASKNDVNFQKSANWIDFEFTSLFWSASLEYSPGYASYVNLANGNTRYRLKSDPYFAACVR